MTDLHPETREFEKRNRIHEKVHPAGGVHRYVESEPTATWAMSDGEGHFFPAGSAVPFAYESTLADYDKVVRERDRYKAALEKIASMTKKELKPSTGQWAAGCNLLQCIARGALAQPDEQPGTIEEGDEDDSR